MKWPVLWLMTFFPSHPGHCPMGLWTKWSFCQGWRLCLWSATWTSTHQGWPGYGHCWVLSLPATETNWTPQYSTIPWSVEPATRKHVGYIGPSWKRQRLNLTRIETLDVDLLSVHAKLIKLPSMDLQNALSTVMVFLTALPLIRELTSQQSKCNSGSMLMQFTGHMFPIILKQLAW